MGLSRKRKFVLNVRISLAEKKMFEAAAKRDGMNLSTWLRFVVRKEDQRLRGSGIRAARAAAHGGKLARKGKYGL